MTSDLSQASREARFYIGLLGLFVVYTTLFLSVFALAPMLTGWHPNVIMSSSMHPTILAGDVVVVGPHDGNALGVGTVITFENSRGVLVTHRIVGMREGGRYATRGDANRVADREPVHPDQILGVGRILVPMIGKPVQWRIEEDWLKLSLFAGSMALSLLAARRATDPELSAWEDAGKYVGRHRPSGRRRMWPWPDSTGRHVRLGRVARLNAS